MIDGLFPDHGKDVTHRPYKFDKPTIVVTSRVHPGEVNASYVLNGLLDLVTDLKSEQGELLRKNFVFKIIPFLNPDGVYRGYNRSNTNGVNLNRFYLDPSLETEPSIYAAKAMIVQQHQNNNLKFYFDLHAHGKIKGCFVFGNTVAPEH